MVDVCFGILLELLAKRKVTAQYLAEKFEISTRTVYRYVDKLSLRHIPVTSSPGRNGGIKISDSFRLPANYFTKDEQSLLLSSLDLFEKSTSVKTRQIKNKLISMHDNKTSEALVINSDKLILEGGLIGDAELYRNKINPLIDAVNEQKLVKIVYHSRNGNISKRTVEPHAFILKNFIWYVYCFCRLRNEFRLFKISRIANILILNEKFERRDKSEFTPWKLDYENNAPYINVVLLVNEKARYDIEEWLGIECISKSHKTDWPYIATSKLKYDANLIPKILSFQNNIKVVSPEDLANDILKTINNVKTIYVNS